MMKVKTHTNDYTTNRHRIVITKNNFSGCCAAAIQYAVALSSNETISLMFCDTDDEVKRLTNAYLSMKDWIETSEGKKRIFHLSGKENEVILTVADYTPIPNKLYKNKEALERTKMLSKFVMGEYDNSESDMLCRISMWYFTLNDEEEFVKKVGEWIYKGEDNMDNNNFNIDELNNLKPARVFNPEGRTEVQKLHDEIEFLKDELYNTRLYYAALKHDSVICCDFCMKDYTPCDIGVCDPEWRGLCEENSFPELAKIKE